MSGHGGLTRAVPVDVRFFARVHKTETCWLWKGSWRGQPRRYGHLMIDRRRVSAHRWSYEHHVGPIPQGMFVDHTCNNGMCVNPEHLRVLTNRENVTVYWREQRDMCRAGLHEMTAENVTWRSAGLYRACVACSRANGARKRERKKVA